MADVKGINISPVAPAVAMVAPSMKEEKHICFDQALI